MNISQLLNSTVCFRSIFTLIIAATLQAHPQIIIAQQVAQSQSRPTVQKQFEIDMQGRAVTQARVAELIKQLGAESYATRQRAQNELQQIGLLAFDQLRNVTFNSDPEVSAAANYLVQSVDVRWSWDTDSIEVRRILEKYGALSVVERATRIDLLAMMDHDEGLVPLCRLARYESRADLDRLAAIRIMQSDREVEGLTAARVDVIRQIIGTATSESTLWLQQYCEYLETKRFDTAWWSDHTEKEVQLALDGSRSTSRVTARELARWVAETTLKSDDRPRAIAVAEKTLRLVRKEAADVLDACYWAMDHRLEEVVDSLVAMHPTFFISEARLEYAVAESLLKRKEVEKANQIAELAFSRTLSLQTLNEVLELKPIIEGPDLKNGFTTSHMERRSVGRELQERSLYDWAEREYRAAISSLEMSDVYYRDIVYRLGDLLQDGQDYDKAAAVLEPIATRIENDSEFRELLRDEPRSAFASDTDSILGQYYFYKAKAAMERNDAAAATLNLTKAIHADTSNPDILIAMHRLGGDQKWYQDTSNRIDKTIKEYNQLITEMERRILKSNPEFSKSTNRDLAQAFNQLAWLLGNIERNTAEGVKMAERAVKLSANNSAQIDTLGRCYFADGQYAKAVETQRKAVKLDPWSRQMKRQLKEFEDRLAATANP